MLYTSRCLLLPGTPRHRSCRDIRCVNTHKTHCTDRRHHQLPCKLMCHPPKAAATKGSRGRVLVHQYCWRTTAHCWCRPQAAQSACLLSALTDGVQHTHTHTLPIIPAAHTPWWAAQHIHPDVGRPQAASVCMPAKCLAWLHDTPWQNPSAGRRRPTEHKTAQSACLLSALPGGLTPQEMMRPSHDTLVSSGS